jgi:hypothetical protein
MNNFTEPKQSSFNCKRMPRKFKKKHKILLNKYPFLTLNQKLWFILGETNKEYRDFLISKIVEK